MKENFIRRVRRFVGRVVMERQILIRSGGTVRAIRLSAGAQVALVLSAIAAGAWIGAASVGFVTAESMRAKDAERGEELVRAVDDLTAELGRTLAQLEALQGNAMRLQAELDEKGARIRDLAQSNNQLSEDLAAANRKVGSIQREKEQLLAEARSARERGERLGREFGATGRPQSGSPNLIDQLHQRAETTVNDLERAIGMTGIDIDKLMRSADDLRPGLGGPLVRLPPGQESQLGPATRLERSLARFAGLQAIVQRLPLAEPVQGNLMSGFGRRLDPFTGRPAMHTGLDISAPTGTPVVATGPGRVTEAGFEGAYGRLVEIDHGLGIRTRYAHLRQISVRVGDRVAPGDQVGTVGSSGRSTGAHLHYEIIHNDKPLDPANFMEAGRNVLKDGKAAHARR